MADDITLHGSYPRIVQLWPARVILQEEQLQADPSKPAAVPRHRVHGDAPPEPARARNHERGSAAGVVLDPAGAEAVSPRHEKVPLLPLRPRVPGRPGRAHTAVQVSVRERQERLRARDVRVRLPLAEDVGLRALPTRQ